MSTKTIGESRVRTTFNPSANSTVDQIKQKTAELINLVERLRTVTPMLNEADEQRGASYPADSETQRLISEAQTRYEDAAHWAVKAATS